METNASPFEAAIKIGADFAKKRRNEMLDIGDYIRRDHAWIYHLIELQRTHQRCEPRWKWLSYVGGRQ